MDNENEVLCSLSVPASVREWGEHEHIERSSYLGREIKVFKGPMPSDFRRVQKEVGCDGRSGLCRIVKSMSSSIPTSSPP